MILLLPVNLAIASHCAEEMPHRHELREGLVRPASILSTGAGLAIRYREGESPPERQKVQTNAVFTETPISGHEPRGNIMGSLEAAANYLERAFGSLGGMSFVQGQENYFPGQLIHKPCMPLLV